MEFEIYQSGNTETTKIGYINRNKQKVHGTKKHAGTDNNQYSYKLECLNLDCGCVYGANGTDIFERKCPNCQNGKPSIKW